MKNVKLVLRVISLCLKFNKSLKCNSKIAVIAGRKRALTNTNQPRELPYEHMHSARAYSRADAAHPPPPSENIQINVQNSAITWPNLTFTNICHRSTKGCNL